MKRRVGVVINQGIGDAILLIPLLKTLKSDTSIHITGILPERHVAIPLLQPWQLIDDYLTLSNRVIKGVPSSLRYLHLFDEIILNHVAASKWWILKALLMGKQVTTNREIPAGFSKIRYLPPKKRVHDIWQNLRLVDTHSSENDAYNTLVNSTPASNLSTRALAKFGLRAPYFVLQPVAANNQVQFKNWGISHWRSFLTMLVAYFPSHQVVLVGDNHEISEASLLSTVAPARIVSTVGQTSIMEAMQIVGHSAAYIGLDSGWVHFSTALGKPTFTIWGGSDPLQYGYERFDAKLHRDICSYLPCHPCNAWPDRNTSRVEKAETCPDYRCILDVAPAYAFEEFVRFWGEITEEQ